MVLTPGPNVAGFLVHILAAAIGLTLGAIGWIFSAQQVASLGAASAVTPPYPYYPYWNGQLAERHPAPVALT